MAGRTVLFGLAFLSFIDRFHASIMFVIDSSDDRRNDLDLIVSRYVLCLQARNTRPNSF